MRGFDRFQQTAGAMRIVQEQPDGIDQAFVQSRDSSIRVSTAGIHPVRLWRPRVASNPSVARLKFAGHASHHAARVPDIGFGSFNQPAQPEQVIGRPAWQIIRTSSQFQSGLFGSQQRNRFHRPVSQHPDILASLTGGHRFAQRLGTSCDARQPTGHDLVIAIAGNREGTQA